MKKWNTFPEKMPPEDVLVQTLSEGGQEQDMIWWKNLWWLKDKSMYVYYTPRYWKELE